MRGARLLFAASLLVALVALVAVVGGLSVPWAAALIGAAFALWLGGAGLETLAMAPPRQHPPSASAWSHQRGRLTPDALLLRYPRATLRFLRRRLGLSQEAFAAHLGASRETVESWESRGRAIEPRYQRRLLPLLARHLATPEGEAFARSLGRDEQETTP